MSEGPAARFEVITPEKARIFLERNNNFRKLDMNRVKRIAADIEQGAWDDNNGEAIKFNTEDDLVDGQHRLHAVVLANKPIKTLVVYGVTSDRSMDTGKPRQASDYLRAQGEINFTVLAATLRNVINWEQDRLIDVGKITHSTNQVVEALNRHPKLRDHVNLAKKADEVCMTSILATVTYIGTECGKDELMPLAEAFISVVDKGIVSNKNDPAYLLRERLIKDKTSKAKLSPKEKLALVIIAWNKYKAGKELSCLKWVAAGLKPQPFPTIE